MWKNFIEMIDWLSQLVEELKAIDEELWAARLDTSLRIGGTSSELLGEIRNFLILFSQSGIPQKMMIDLEIRNAIKDLDSALGKRSAILDIFDWLPQMVEDLRAIGEDGWAKRLDRALKSGGTSGMQFEEIHTYLIDFSLTEFPRKLRIERKIRKALNELSKVDGKWRYS